MNREDFQELIETGIEKCRKGQYEDALSLFHDAEKFGLSEPLLYNRSKAYFKLHRLVDSMKDLNQLIDMQPDNSAWFAERAVIYHYREDKANALSDLDKAVDLDPENGFRFASRAFIKDYYGDHKGAIEDYERAIELDPEDAISYNNKGLVEEKLGYKEKAKASFVKADKLDKEITSSSGSKQQPASSYKKRANQQSPKPVRSQKNKMTFEHFIQTLSEVTTSRKGVKTFLNFVFGKKDQS